MADDYVDNEFGSDAAMKTRSGRGKSGGRRARVSSGAKSASILRKSATSSKTRSSGAKRRSSSSSKSNPLSRSRSVKSATKTARKAVSGARGKAGPVIVPLCAPCRSGASGRATVDESVLNALESGRTYVNVHTRKNPAGEIRGQLAAVPLT